MFTNRSASKGKAFLSTFSLLSIYTNYFTLVHTCKSHRDVISTEGRNLIQWF